MIPDPLILLLWSLFNGEDGEGSCETAWGICMTPSSLSAPLSSPIPAQHRPGTKIHPFSLCGLFHALSPSCPLAERDLQQPRNKDQAGKGDPAPRQFFRAAARSSVRQHTLDTGFVSVALPWKGVAGMDTVGMGRAELPSLVPRLLGRRLVHLDSNGKEVAE